MEEHIPMITILNNDFTVRQTIENAINESYSKTSNQIDMMSFELSNDDVKMNSITERCYVELTDSLDGEYIGLFKLMPTLTTYNDDNSTTKFTCYHVAVTLTDEVVDGKLTFIKKPIKYVIIKILEQQRTKHWEVGDILINKNISYEVEDVNSLHEPLSEIMEMLPLDYVWEYDTEVYPWRLNLIKMNEEPVARVKLGYNMESFEIDADPSNIINRVYAKGTLVTPKYDSTGKEVSRTEKIITLANVQPGGKRYIEDTDSILKYGIINYVHSGEEYYDPIDLYIDALNILYRGSIVPISWRVKALDLAKLSEDPVLEIDKFKINTVVRAETEYFGDMDLYIRSISKSNMTGEPQDVELVLDSGGKIPGVNFSTMKRDLDKNLSKVQQIRDKTTEITNIVETTFTLDEDGNIVLDGEIAAGLKGEDAVVWSTTAPTDTTKIWGDSTENIIKRYDSDSKTWISLDKAALEALEEYQNTVGTQISEAVGEVSKEIEQTANDVKALEGDITTVKNDITDVDKNRLEAEKNLKDLIDTNKENIEAELQMINTYFNFSPDGLLIGKEDNPIKMLLDNDSMSFVDNGVEVASISNEELVIIDGVIKRSLTLGNFEFVPRESGNLSFRKKG